MKTGQPVRTTNVPRAQEWVGEGPPVTEGCYEPGMVPGGSHSLATGIMPSCWVRAQAQLDKA